MSFYEKVFLKEVEEKKDIKESGGYNGIPFCFENYQNYVSSIDKGVYYALLSASGNAKSFFMRYAFIYEPLKFAKETGYKVKILYFALEDSKIMVYKKIVAHYLWEHHQVYINQDILDSKTEPIPDKYMELLLGDTDFYEYFEENVYIYNDDLDPDAILARCEKAHKAYGDDVHIIAIIDNYANVAQGNYKSKYEAVETLSREHVRLNLCKNRNFTVVAILQEDLDTSKYAGRNATANISSIEPNLSSVGDVKIIIRDMHIVWALFNPWKYEIPMYPHSKAGWNTEILRNKFRSLIMLKNNLGDMAPRLGLLFEGSKGNFSELPQVNDEIALQKLYVKTLDDERKFKSRSS